MKENSIEKKVKTPKPPCKGYDSFDYLLEAVRQGVISALECLGRICLTQIIPSLKRNRVSDTEAEDAAIIALAEFVRKLRRDTNINIGLLWIIARSRLIDIIRKRKNEGDKDLIEDLMQELPDTGSSDDYDEDKVNAYMKLFKEVYLNEKEKEIFILLYEDNLTIAEIIEKTKLSKSEVYRLKAIIDNIKKKQFEYDLREGKI